MYFSFNLVSFSFPQGEYPLLVASESVGHFGRSPKQSEGLR